MSSRNQGSRKVRFSGGYNVYGFHFAKESKSCSEGRLTRNRPMRSNPFNFWGKVIDCGDIPVTS